MTSNKEFKDNTKIEDKVGNEPQNRDVTAKEQKFLYKEPIVLLPIVCLSVLDGLSAHVTPKSVSEISREIFAVYNVSISAVPVIGLIFATFLSYVSGRKHVYRYLFALSVILFIIILSSDHPTAKSVIFILSGLISGGSLVMNTVAISEYSTPKHRFAWAIADKAAYNTIGLAMSTVTLGNGAVFYTTLVIQIVLGLICLGSTWVWPESPYWLANKGKLEQSREAFLWLRGTGGKEELASVLKVRRRSNPAKVFWFSLFITLATISNSIFSDIILVKLSIHYHIFSNVYQFYTHFCFRLLISCALAFVSYFITRKLLFIIVSVISFTLCYVEALCLYVLDRDIDGILFHLLYNTTAVILSSGPVAFGVILCVEIAPHKYNTVLSCICHIASSFVMILFSFITHFTFNYLHVSFWVVLCTTVALVAAPLYYFFAPETKDKTLLEIQRSYIPDEIGSNTERNESILLNEVTALE